MITNKSSSLTLLGLQFSVFLGVYPEEQDRKQSIAVDARIRFPKPPEACSSDQLAETHCYHKLVLVLREALQDRKFLLIEYLTKEIHTIFKTYFPETTLISVRVKKQPPIPELRDGVYFEYGDEAVAWSF